MRDRWGEQEPAGREQLWERARHLSRELRQYQDAAQLYQTSVARFGRDPYSSHYLAYNLERARAPLDRSLLHVFVAGPGYGEGIAVALPHSGWLVLDGCRVSRGRLPILAILDRWRSSTEPVEALLLTHPHTDLDLQL